MPDRDALTGLLRWHERDRSRALEGCLLLIDLDEFRARVNEPAGHEAGDRALAAAATSITRAAAPADLVAYRHGGDSFVVTGVADPRAAIDLAISIRAAIARDLAIHGAVTASVGIVDVADAGGDAARIDAIASHALAEAKRNGRGVALRRADEDEVS